MDPATDDNTPPQSSTVMRIPTWAASNPMGRAYARRRVARTIDRDLERTGYHRTGPVCIHFATTDGIAIAAAHFTVRDNIAAAFANSGAEQ